MDHFTPQVPEMDKAMSWEQNPDPPHNPSPALSQGGQLSQAANTYPSTFENCLYL